MWSHIVEYFNSAVNFLVSSFSAKAIVAAILSYFGWSSGFLLNIAAWIGGIFLKKEIKNIESSLTNAAGIADQTKTDKQNVDQLNQDVKNGKDEQTLVNDETNLLNGGRKP